jgi:sulfotransferase family protein
MPEPNPILVVGISRRSGTNFLASLLQLHEDCAAPAAPVLEDHLLRDLPVLREYTARAAARWPRRWGDRASAHARLERHLGDGLAAFLHDGVDAPRVVSKTPSPEHLDHYPSVLPNAYVLVLLRDGRSVVDSLRHGFRFSFRKAVDEWVTGARAILDFEHQVLPAQPKLRVRFVRFEAIVADPEAQLRELFEFCDLDPSRADFDAARNAPVIGSSYARTESGRMTWQPMARDEDFAPAARFANWTATKRARFDWLAGTEQRALGYESSPDARYDAYNRVADLCTPLVHARDDAVRRFYARRAGGRDDHA